MRLVIKALLIWGLFDSAFLAKNPKGWERFWQKNMQLITDHPPAPRVVAIVQAALCSWLLKKI